MTKDYLKLSRYDYNFNEGLPIDKMCYDKYIVHEARVTQLSSINDTGYLYFC